MVQQEEVVFRAFSVRDDVHQMSGLSVVETFEVNYKVYLLVVEHYIREPQMFGWYT